MRRTVAHLSAPRERRPAATLGLQFVVGYAALAAVLLSALALGGNRPAAWVALAVWIAVLFVVQIGLDLRAAPDPRRRRAVLPALLYGAALGWGLVQIWPDALPGHAHPAWDHAPGAALRLSPAPVHGAHDLLRLCLYAMVFWILARTAEKAHHAQALLVTIAVFGTSLATAAIAWAVAGENPILAAGPSSVVSGSFVNRNAFASYAILGLVANTALYIDRSGRSADAAEGASRALRDTLDGFFRGNWLFALGATLCLAAILFTQSRAGTVAALVALVLVVISSAGHRRTRAPWVLGLIGALVLFAVTSLSSAVSQRLLATAEDEIRFDLYARLLAAIAERPVTGHGLGAFEDAFRPYLTLDLGQLEWDFAHNMYLETVFELGLVGALLLAAALGAISVRLLLGVLRRQRHRAFSCVALACLAGLGFHAIFDFGPQMPATAALLSAILGMGWMQSFGTPRPARGAE